MHIEINEPVIIGFMVNNNDFSVFLVYAQLLYAQETVLYLVFAVVSGHPAPDDTN